MRLADNVAIVTAASREIGAAMAGRLARDGCAVLLAHYGELARATAVLETIRTAGGRAALHEADLSSVAACAALVARAVELFGRLDIMAANAGVTINRPFLETDEPTWDTLFDTNVKSAYFCAQAAAKQMIAQGGGGRIVFSSSVTGIQACDGLSAYGITKAALRHMARTLASELGPHRITVNALGIGAIVNERNLADDPAYAARWAAVTPLGRVGTPEDVAAALMLLVSPDADWITGQTLVVDGGWTLRSVVP
jgi:3-oxoacyl-[acyl-carrier protein] reductase